MLDLTYSDVVGNSKTRALILKENEFDQILLELKSFLKLQEIESIKISFDDASGVIMLGLMLPITPESAAQLCWDFTERLIEKDLEKSSLLISLLGTNSVLF